jgi:hypothetical protein
MPKKLAEAECYMGPGEYTYRIEEVYDKRLGQVIYELYSTLRASGVSSLLGEYNTREDARNGMLRHRDLDAAKAEGRG